jgi:hypothetical protein
MAVDLKKYDFPQVLRSVFEVEDNCLRVKVVNGTPGGGGELEVLITHTEDSVRLGDGTDFLTSTHVGPQVGLDVAIINVPLPVTATDLDIRDLSFATDKVDVSGSTIAISGFPTSLDVTVVSSVLPTGASTSALQTTGNSSLASIDSKLTSPLTVQAADLDIRDLAFATDKVDTSGSSISVSNFPAVQPVSGTVDLSATTLAALESVTVQNPGGSSAVNIQDGGNSITVDGSVSITGSVAVTGPLTDTQLRATPVPVSGTITANIGTTNGLALDTSVNSLLKPTSTLSAVTTLGSITNTVVIKADTAVNQTNALKVDGSATTQPISASSLPLPTGASTSALQTTGNSSLSSIDAKTPALGQSTMSGSTPVVIASNQSSIPVSATQSGTWSSRTQDGAGNNLTSQTNGSQQALDVGINVAGVQIDPRGPLPVTFTHSSATATNASSVALAANTSRKYLLIQNNSNQTIWLRFGAAAVAAAPSLQLTSGSSFTLENNTITTQSVNVIRGGAANATFTIVEGA